VPRELLVRLYVDERLTMREIGERLGVGKSTIHYWLDDYGIDRRRGGTPAATRPDRETLVRLYLHEKQSLEDIATEFDVSRETVRTWCRRDGIALRSKRDAARVRLGITEEEMTERERIRNERARHRERYQITEGELRELYTQRGLTYAEIAEMKGVSIGFVAKLAKRLGIETRPPGRPLGWKAPPPSQ
jgi:transposase